MTLKNNQKTSSTTSSTTSKTTSKTNEVPGKKASHCDKCGQILKPAGVPDPLTFDTQVSDKSRLELMEGVTFAQMEIRCMEGLPGHYKQYLENGLENAGLLILDGKSQSAFDLLNVMLKRMMNAPDLSKESKDAIVTLLQVVRLVKDTSISAENSVRTWEGLLALESSAVGLQKVIVKSIRILFSALSIFGSVIEK